MNPACPCALKRRIATVSLLLACSVASAAVLMAGCGGNSSQPTLSGNTEVTLLASSTANDQLSELTLNITGVSLTNKEGKSVTLLATPQYVEFMHLNGGVEPLVTISVPQDVYTSATISANYGVPLCMTYNPSAGEDGTYAAYTAPVSGVTVNLPEPVVVSGAGMGLELNLQVSKSTNFTSCPSIVNGAIPFRYTPVFNVTPVSFASQPTNSVNGMATELRGLIDSVSANGGSFNVVGDFGAGTDAPAWQVSTNASTAFQGISGASQLDVGLPMDMDVAIQTDGTLVATRVAVYDTTPVNLSFSIGPQVFVGPSVPAPPAMLSLAVENQGPDFTGDDGGLFPYNFGGAVFQISGQISNLSTLPFTASFNAANMVSGQDILVTTHAPNNNNPPVLASTITLLPQTINGEVVAVSNSGSFTTYTVSLAAYDLFPDLAVQPGQTTLLTNPGRVVVYVDSNTQMLNTEQLTVGSVLRFYGLVFNASGILSMDCAQVSDGVTE